MAATPVPSFTAPPDFPALSDRAAGTYNSKAFAWATAWQSTTGPNVYAMADSARLNALEAKAQTDTAVAAGTQAATAAATALSAANFKGEWPSLSGALAKPACVKHNGRFWMLLNNLADVTASQPVLGNADWTSLDAGITPSQVITVNAAVVPGVRNIIAASGVVLDMTGVAWAKGDYFGVREAIGAGTYTINYGATKDRTQTRGSIVIDAGFRQLDRTYEDATRGLI